MGKHSFPLYFYLFILFLVSPVIFIEAQKIILSTVTNDKPDVLLVNDSTVYYAINKDLFIAYHYADSNGNWNKTIITATLPETPSTGTMYLL